MCIGRDTNPHTLEQVHENWSNEVLWGALRQLNEWNSIPFLIATIVFHNKKNCQNSQAILFLYIFKFKLLNDPPYKTTKALCGWRISSDELKKCSIFRRLQLRWTVLSAQFGTNVGLPIFPARLEEILAIKEAARWFRRAIVSISLVRNRIRTAFRHGFLEVSLPHNKDYPRNS